MTAQEPHTMASQPTSLKIPGDLKDRIDRLAREGGESTHAFMVRALRGAVEAMERRAAFIREAQDADRRMEEAGTGHDHEEVARWLRGKAAGRKTRRPRPASWRR